jgi:hypothetical protein
MARHEQFTGPRYVCMSPLIVVGGIDLLSPATFLAMTEDLRRFESPRMRMDYLGLVPSEHSSGGCTLCLLTETCNGHEHLLPLRSRHAPLLKPSRGKVNPDAKESRPHRGIGPNVLDTDSRVVVMQDDRGQHTINLPEILCTGAA